MSRFSPFPPFSLTRNALFNRSASERRRNPQPPSNILPLREYSREYKKKILESRVVRVARVGIGEGEREGGIPDTESKHPATGSGRFIAIFIFHSSWGPARSKALCSMHGDSDPPLVLWSWARGREGESGGGGGGKRIDRWRMNVSSARQRSTVRSFVAASRDGSRWW